jgi:CBS domain-containing protein
MSLERFTRKEVVVARPEESAADVALKMENEHVGAVVIVDLGRPIGIITDRDLALRLVASRLPYDTAVRTVMSTDLVTACVDDTVDEIVYRMRTTGVRRLPIVNEDGALIGLVSLDDLYVMLAGELGETAHAVLDNRGP